MKRALVLGSALAVLSAAPAAAQTEFGIDASVFSSYVWRGITLTSKPVLEPDAWLSFPIGSASLTVGAWGNVELGSYDDADDVTQGGGTSLNLSEVDPYAEIGFSAGKASLTVGGTAYIYPNDDTAPANSDINTVEIYGKASLDAPLAPSIAVYYDVDKVKGLYLEGSLSKGFPLGASTLNLTATAGFSNGMDPSADDASANFADNGFTHLDLGASIDFSAGPFSISPSFHFQINGDDATKYTNFNPDNLDKDVKLWGGVTISWSRILGAAAEE